MYEIIYREMFYKGGVVMVKEKVSGVELIGWEEDELLKLKRDNGFKYLNNRRDLTAPECSISVVELTQKLEEHFNDKLNILLEEIHSHLQEQDNKIDKILKKLEGD